MTDVNLTKIKSQPMWIGDNILGKIKDIIPLDKFSSIVILTDKKVAPLWLNILKEGLGREAISIIIPSGEKSKTIAVCERIWTTMLERNTDRKSLLINLGGGVIGDLGGFVASTYMRGIDFIQVPTTLLAMVDASHGGKTGVNLSGVKNIIGTFKEPEAVIVDISTLDSLPKRELVSGMGEVIKHAVIGGSKHLNRIRNKKLDGLNHKDLKDLIEASIKVKLKVIKKDPREKGLRKVLNFGHTIGHAIEAISHKASKPLLHGEAIAIGMVAECRLANLAGILTKEESDLIEEVIKNSGLPIDIKAFKLEEIMDLIIKDKKNRKSKINWSLPSHIGSVSHDIMVPERLVVEAIKSIIL